VPSRIIYDLGTQFLNDPGLPAVIDALAKATKGKPRGITVVEAEGVIEIAWLRIGYGDYPVATLRALDQINENDAWAAGLSEVLKKARPDTAEAVEKVEIAHRYQHLEKLFGAALPDWLNWGMLNSLDGVKEEHCEVVLQKLQAATQPLNNDQVAKIVFEAWHGPSDEDVEDQDEDEDEDEDETPPTPEQDEQDEQDEPDLDAELSAAVRVIVHRARRPLPTSVAASRALSLVEAARYLDKLHELATGGSAAKRIADRAEARSREGKATAAGIETASAERWSER
jgi:hypothetical protein